MSRLHEEFTAAGTDKDGDWVADLPEFTLSAAQEYVRRHGGHVERRVVSDWQERSPLTEFRREVFAEVSQAMNRVADIWERDGSDPCRVRITREYANAYRAYAEGFGEPTGTPRV